MSEEETAKDLAKPWWKSKKIFVFLILVLTFLITIGLQAVESVAVPEAAVNYLALGVFACGTTLVGALGAKETVAMWQARK